MAYVFKPDRSCFGERHIKILKKLQEMFRLCLMPRVRRLLKPVVGPPWIQSKQECVNSLRLCSLQEEGLGSLVESLFCM